MYRLVPRSYICSKQTIYSLIFTGSFFYLIYNGYWIWVSQRPFQYWQTEYALPPYFTPSFPQNVDLYTHTHAHAHAHTHICMYICIYVYMYICIYVYMYIYTHNMHLMNKTLVPSLGPYSLSLSLYPPFHVYSSHSHNKHCASPWSPWGVWGRTRTLTRRTGGWCHAAVAPAPGTT